MAEDIIMQPPDSWVHRVNEEYAQQRLDIAAPHPRVIDSPSSLPNETLRALFLDGNKERPFFHLLY
jgi:hypothetical protein